MRKQQSFDREGPIPVLSLLLGYGAMMPFPVGVIAAWTLAEPWGQIGYAATIIWGSAILLFLSGVRRGLSFWTPGGPRIAQLAAMLWLFGLGLSPLLTSMFVPAQDRSPALIIPLVLGFASLIALDPLAARRGEVPLFFARLRPLQMLIPVACLVVLLVLTR